MAMRHLTTTILLLAGLLTGCGGGSSSSSTSSAPSDAPTTATASESMPEPGSASASPSETEGTDDGAVLVFQSRGSVWTQAPGAEPQNAAAGVKTDNQHPDWSPDGSRIAFESNFNAIWLVGTDGTGAQQLFTCDEPCAAAYEPAWSPAGDLLAFVHIVGDGTHTVSAQLRTLDPGTGGTTVLQEDAAGDVWEYTPRWSGDGSRLVVEHDVFASNRLDESQTLSTDLRVVDATTGEATPIPGTDGGQTPDWSRTEDLVVYSDGVNLFSIAPDGTGRRPLTRFDGSRQSAIQPTFTPDGTSVVFTWIRGTQGSGTETTLAGFLDLATGDLTADRETAGATHVRVRP